jgi:MFS family permease
MFKLNQHLSIPPSIVALSVVSLIVMMGSSMVTPSLTLYAKQGLGADEFLVGAVIAGFAIGRFAFDIPAGFLADRLGIKKTMILGLGALVGSSTLAGFAPTYWILLVARILEGVGSSIYVSATTSFVLISSDLSSRGTNMGTYQSILMLGPIIGPIVGAPIAAFLGYNAPYFAFAGMMLLALLTISILLYRGKFDVKRIASHNESVSNNQAKVAIYLNSASIATFGFAFLRSGIYTTGMPLFAYGHLELSVFDVGIMLTMASIANLAASFFSGRLTQMYGMQKPLFAAILFSAVLVAIIPLTSTMVQLLAVITLVGITSGFFGQSIAWAAEQIEEKVRRGQENGAGSRAVLGVHSHVTRGIGFNRMVGDLGLILGPLFVGYLISIFSKDSLIWLIAFGSTSAVLGIVSFLIFRSGFRCKIR